MAITARPLVLDIWRLRHHGLSIADVMSHTAENRSLARTISNRVRVLVS